MKRIFFSMVFSMVFIVLITAQTYQNQTIYTPNGTSVAALKLISGDFTAQQKQELKEYYLIYYDYRITFISEATRSYNCHAYAWYVTEGGDKVWINTPGDDAFWNDGSYVLCSSSLGTKVSFALGDHSAITTNQQGIFESKWGQVPVFRHTINDCPYDSSILNYYTAANFTNQTVTSNTTVTSCGDLNVQNVTVTNNAKLTLDAANTTTVNGPFEVQSGSQLEIK
jgi:hypothetical protein